MNDIEPSPQKWTVWLDHAVTRRKSFHVVTDPMGAVAFRARRMSDIVRFLWTNEATCYDMRTDHDPPHPSVTVTCYEKDHQ